MTEQEYYELIKVKLDKKIASDSRIKSILKRVEKGTATFQDTSKYSEIASGMLGEIFSESVLEINGELTKEAVCRKLLRDRYDDINSVLSSVQTSIDSKLGLHIRPQKAAFPLERVMQIAHSLEDPTVSDDTIQRRAQSVANVAMSFHDDYIQENAKFRNDAGIQCFITRTSSGSCCSWCSDVAGRYEYGFEPSDIYRRHDNCNCTVIYENGNKRQDVWSKRSWDAKKIDEPKTSATVLTPQQAEALEQRNLSQYRGLTDSNRSDIISIEDQFRKDGDDPMYEVDGRAIDSHPREVEEMINQLQSWGVSVNQESNTMGYGAVRLGEPGTISISEDASYGAWCHEFQHAKDDMEAGWNAQKVLWTDPEERIRRERNAYAVEIDLAIKAGRHDIAERLEANLNAEIERIWRSYRGYF